VWLQYNIFENNVIKTKLKHTGIVVTREYQV